MKHCVFGPFFGVGRVGELQSILGLVIRRSGVLYLITIQACQCLACLPGSPILVCAAFDCA